MQSQLVQYGLNNNGIQFQSIQEQYPLGENVYCYFTVPETVQQPEQGDCIAVVPVGCRNVSELVCQKVINVENIWGNGEQRFGHVIFESHMLPTIGQQQYQFIYVRNGGLVQGISRPFAFVPVCGQYGQLTTGLRSFGIQQWINRLKQTVCVQQPHHIQYQQGLRFLQRGLEQVLLNEFEGVRCLQQGLQHIQQYVQLNQVLPQLFHQEIRRVQQAVQCLEQLFCQYRQNCIALPQIVENTIFRQHVQCIQQCLKQLRTIVPVPVSVFVQEPVVLRSKIQEIFSELPVECILGQQSLEQIVNTVGQILIEQEKIEQIQRQSEQERIVSHLKTLCNILVCQQQQQQRIQFVNVQQKVVIVQELCQLLKEIMQQVQCLRQKEQFHLSTIGQRLVKLMTLVQGKNVVELPYLRELVLGLVSGQVLSQVGLRGIYKEMAGLLDEIEVHLGDCQQYNQQLIQVIPEKQQIEQILMRQTPVEFELSKQIIPCVNVQTELNNNYVLPTCNNLSCFNTIEQLRNKFNELKSVRCASELVTPVFGQRLVEVVQPVQGLQQEQCQMTTVLARRNIQDKTVLQSVSYPLNLNRLNF